MTTPSWSAGARTVAEFSGDGGFSFFVPASSGGIVAGLNSDDFSNAPQEIQHGFFFTGVSYAVIESGTERTARAVTPSGAQFAITRVGGVVKYLVDEDTVYTSAVPSTGIVFLDASLLMPGDAIHDVALYSPYQEAPAQVSVSFPMLAVSAYQGATAAASFPAMKARANASAPPAADLTGVSATSFPPTASCAGGYGAGVDVWLPPMMVTASPEAYAAVYAEMPGLFAIAAGRAATPGVYFDFWLPAVAPTPAEAPEVASGQISMTAPAARVVAFGRSSLGDNDFTYTAPKPTLSAFGRSSLGDNDFTYTAPKPTLSAFGGATAKLSAPSPALSITATVVNFGRAALTAPSPKLSASGTVSGMASAILTPPSPNLVGYGGAVCSITITGKATLTATGTTGSIGGAALSCPLFELTASATAQNYGSANLLAPSPRMGASAQAWLIAPSAQITAIGSAVVTATYEAYAVNLGHRNPQATTNEVTRYTNFPFTHVVRYQNSYYGANSTGLYLLEGTTDEATPIPWSFKTGITDFDDAKQKTVASAYFGGSMPPATTVTLFEGDKVGVPYAQTTPRGADLQNYRETFARGVKGRYYALGLSGTGEIGVDDIDFEIKQLTRRI